MASRHNSSYDHHESTTSPLPFHLCFFLLTLLMFVSLSWYLSYESALESFIDNTKLFIVVSPLLVLGAVHIFSTFFVGPDGHHRGMSFMPPLREERESMQGGGGGSSPWGVALVLVLLLLMVSYQSSIHERWFPLLSR